MKINVTLFWLSSLYSSLTNDRKTRPQDSIWCCRKLKNYSKTLDRFRTCSSTCLLQLVLNCNQPVKNVKLPLKLCKFLSEKSESKCYFDKIMGHQLYQHSFPCECFFGKKHPKTSAIIDHILLEGHNAPYDGFSIFILGAIKISVQFINNSSNQKLLW